MKFRGHKGECRSCYLAAKLQHLNLKILEAFLRSWVFSHSWSGFTASWQAGFIWEQFVCRLVRLMNRAHRAHSCDMFNHLLRGCIAGDDAATAHGGHLLAEEVL